MVRCVRSRRQQARLRWGRGPPARRSLAQQRRERIVRGMVRLSVPQTCPHGRWTKPSSASLCRYGKDPHALPRLALGGRPAPRPDAVGCADAWLRPHFRTRPFAEPGHGCQWGCPPALSSEASRHAGCRYPWPRNVGRCPHRLTLRGLLYPQVQSGGTRILPSKTQG